MYKLEEFKRLVRDFSDVADFLVVYVAEAHSTGQQQRLLLQRQGPHRWFKSVPRRFVVVHSDDLPSGTDTSTASGLFIPLDPTITSPLNLRLNLAS